jgi:hypothetical protein
MPESVPLRLGTVLARDIIHPQPCCFGPLCSFADGSCSQNRPDMRHEPSANVRTAYIQAGSGWVVLSGWAEMGFSLTGSSQRPLLGIYSLYDAPISRERS